MEIKVESEAKTLQRTEFPRSGTNIRGFEDVERTIFIRPGLNGGFLIGGRVASSSGTSEVGLDQLLLENTLAKDRRRHLINAYRVLGAFGANLGKILAGRVAAGYPSLSDIEQSSLAVKSVLRSMRASYDEQQREDGMYFIVSRCPICENAQSTDRGSAEELAHHALNVLFRTLMQVVGPELRFKLALSPGGVHRILVQQPLENASEQGISAEDLNSRHWGI